jgi:hypothetical protein
MQKIKSNTFRIIIDEKPVFKTKNIKEYCAETTSYQFVINKYGQEAYNNINWTPLQRISSKYSKYSSVIKMINSLAPTKNKLFQQQRSSTQKCPLCEQNQETDQHVLICRKNPEKYKEKIEKIQKHAGLKNTNTEQMKNLIGKILQENIDEDDDLNKDQKLIGWKRILQAKVGTSFQKWIQTQLNRIISQKATENLIFAIIEQWHQAWKFRNKSIKHDTMTSIKDRTEENEKKLAYIYGMRHNLQTELTQFLLPTFEYHIKKDKTNIQNWINIHFEAMETQIKEKVSNINWRNYQNKTTKNQMENSDEGCPMRG